MTSETSKTLWERTSSSPILLQKRTQSCGCFPQKVTVNMARTTDEQAGCSQRATLRWRMQWAGPDQHQESRSSRRYPGSRSANLAWPSPALTCPAAHPSYQVCPEDIVPKHIYMMVPPTAPSMILKISQRKPHRTIWDVGVCLGRRDSVQSGHRKIPRNPVSSSCDSHPAGGGESGRGAQEETQRGKSMG